MNRGNRRNRGESATKLIPLLFGLLGLLVMFGVPFLISIFILIFLGAIFLLYKNKTEVNQRFPTLTARLPSWKKAAKMVVTLVIVGVIILYPIGWFCWKVDEKVKEKELIISDASLGQQMDGWEGEGVKIRGGEFLLSPGASMTRKYKKGTMVTVALVNVEGKGKIEIFIKDLYDYSSDPEKNLGYVFRRDAKFTFTVAEERVTSSNIVEFGNSMTPVKLIWDENKTFKNMKGKFISVAVGEKVVGSYYGTEGNFSSYLWEICPVGYQGRGIKRPFKVTIRNLGDKEILIDDIVVRKEPL